MKSAIDLRIATEARKDLDDIFWYTVEEWGIDQAEHYQDELDGAFLRLKQFPGLGRKTSNEVRELILRHHVILYIYRDETVTVLRVINPRQLRR